MAKTLYTFILFLCFYAASAQHISIIGKVVDSSTKNAIPYATVTVYNSLDSAIIDFRLSNGKGEFKIPAIPLNVKARIIITFVGMKSFRKELLFLTNTKEFDLGNIMLEPTQINLNELVVTAEIPPVIVRNDTIEFNASSFKTLPTAILEDLLKKLNGITIDKDGSIRYEGKRVDRILVDSKAFFGGNVKVASRNLPADIIDKVQVMNDPEALIRNPDIPKNSIPQVINLKLKKSIKKGMFGKIYGGLGNKERYEVGGILNTFRDTLQISVLAYGNNINTAGFDVNEIGRIGELNLSLGGAETGIQTSVGSGVNINTVLGKRVELNLRYFYGRSKNTLTQLVNTQQVLNDTLLNTRNINNVGSETTGHTFGGKIKGMLGAKTYFSFEPVVSLNNGNANGTLISNTSTNFFPELNRSYSTQHKNLYAPNYFATITATHVFKKTGRRINIVNDTKIGENKLAFYNDALNEFFDPNASIFINQLRKTDNDSFISHSLITFTDYISKKYRLGVVADLDYFRTTDNIITLIPNQNGGYNSIVPILSNKL